jgi:hypothetical protein
MQHVEQAVTLLVCDECFEFVCISYALEDRLHNKAAFN